MPKEAVKAENKKADAVILLTPQVRCFLLGHSLQQLVYAHLLHKHHLSTEEPLVGVDADVPEGDHQARLSADRQAPSHWAVYRGVYFC